LPIFIYLLFSNDYPLSWQLQNIKQICEHDLFFLLESEYLSGEWIFLLSESALGLLFYLDLDLLKYDLCLFTEFLSLQL
jgi:hypothetical protein